MEADRHRRRSSNPIVGIRISSADKHDASSHSENGTSTILASRQDRSTRAGSFSNTRPNHHTKAESRKQAKVILQMVANRNDDPVILMEKALTARRYAMAVSLSPGVALKTAMETNHELRNFVDQYEDARELADAYFPSGSHEWQSQDLLHDGYAQASSRRGSLMPTLPEFAVPATHSRRPSKTFSGRNSTNERVRRERAKIMEAEKRQEKGVLDKINYIYNMLEQKRAEFREEKRQDVSAHAERSRKRLIALQKHMEESRRKKELEMEAIRQEWMQIHKEVRCRPAINKKVGVSKMLEFYRHMAHVKQQKQEQKEVEEKKRLQLIAETATSTRFSSKANFLSDEALVRRDNVSKAPSHLSSIVQLAKLNEQVSQTKSTAENEQQLSPTTQETSIPTVSRKVSQIQMPQLNALNMEISMSQHSVDCWKGHLDKPIEEKKTKRRNKLIGEMAGSIVKFKESSRRLIEIEERVARIELNNAATDTEPGDDVDLSRPSTRGRKSLSDADALYTMEAELQLQAEKLAQSHKKQLEDLDQVILRSSRRSCFSKSTVTSQSPQDDALYREKSLRRTSSLSQKSTDSFLDSESEEQDLDGGVSPDVIEPGENANTQDEEIQQDAEGENLPISSDLALGESQSAPETFSLERSVGSNHSATLSVAAIDKASPPPNDTTPQPTLSLRSFSASRSTRSRQNPHLVQSKEARPDRPIVPLSMSEVLQDETIKIKPALHAPHYFWKTPFLI